MINAVTYKTSALYKQALSDRNILQTHEPFNIIVYDDPSPVKRDMTKILKITEVDDITKIPTGLALLKLSGDPAESSYYYRTCAIKNEAYKILKQNNIKIIDEISYAYAYVVEIPVSMSFAKFSSTINKPYDDDENVFSIIEEDVIFEGQSCDYYAWPYLSQWHLDDIEAQQAYELLDQGDYNSADGVTYGEWFTRDVAIIDGHGFEFTHPDLDNNEYPTGHPGRFMTRENWDCVNNNGNPQPNGLNDKHGTVMAGIAASGWADRRFLRGVGLDHVNAQCLRIGYNVTPTGKFSTATTFVVRALNKAALNGNCAATVMPYSQTYYSPFTNVYLNRVRTFGRFGKGMPIFAAAGNTGADSISNVYPAAYDDVMAIGASTQDHLKASFSNYGPGLFATAPGVSIFAIDRCCGRGYNINPDSTYGSVTYFTGTSAASVIAATIAATMVVAYPEITETQIRSILAITARRLGPYTYNSESNEIGLSLGISDEMGNGILTQADSISNALTMAEDLNAGYINYAINDFNIRWSFGFNGPWSFTQPIPAGAYLQGDINFTVSNDGPNTIVVGGSWPLSMQITLNEGAPAPQIDSPMMLFQATSNAGGGVSLESGQSQTITREYYVIGNNPTCGLNGNYYLVCKVDPLNAIFETSEEDNFRYEPVEFTTNHPASTLYCVPDSISTTSGTTRLCFYDTGTTAGNATIGDENYFVLSEVVSYTNNFPVNDDLQLNSIIPTRLSSTNQWQVHINVTNIGDTAIQEFRVHYEFNPGLGSILGGLQLAGGEQTKYMGRNLIASMTCNGGINTNYLSYNDSYPAALSWVWEIPSIGNPLQPGESRSFTKVLEFHPTHFPTILTGRITGVNYRQLVGGTQSIHVAQSSIIYG